MLQGHGNSIPGLPGIPGIPSICKVGPISVARRARQRSRRHGFAHLGRAPVGLLVWGGQWGFGAVVAVLSIVGCDQLGSSCFQDGVAWVCPIANHPNCPEVVKLGT